ncbi:uncharacterized protein METZ01_LOCUS225742, partial [marine metagenome]
MKASLPFWKVLLRIHILLLISACQSGKMPVPEMPFSSATVYYH